jgi:hypothetical protein
MSNKLTNTDDEFLDAGKTEGLTIWRIENFKVVKVPKQTYGKLFFYK